MDGEISAAAVRERVDSGDDRLRIVDIRSPREFASGHIPGSENVPFDVLPTRIEELAGADHIVTVCPHGKASVQAARLISSYEGTTDATVESMAGGIEAWDGPLDGEAPVSDAASESDAPF